MMVDNIFVHNHGECDGNIIRYPDEKKPCFKDRVDIHFNGKNNKVVFGEGVSGNRIFIELIGNNNRLLIGKECVINGALILRTHGNTIDIGKFTTMVNVRIECDGGTEVRIGQDCMFSRDIVIRSGDGHTILDLSSGKIINKSENVVIGDHVWVGYGVSIGKGTVVQKNSIIGTGAFVNKKFKKGNVILAGVPAKIMKEGIIWDRQNPARELPLSRFEALKSNYMFNELDND